jgi:hypothetical protein
MTVDPTFSLFTPALIVVSVVFPVLATVTVGLRFYVKHMRKVSLYWDDWTILISLVHAALPLNFGEANRTTQALCWSLSIITWVMAPSIGINHVKMSPDKAALETFKVRACHSTLLPGVKQNITPMLQYFWINEIPFSIVLGLVKISVLLFYGRIFPIPLFRKAVTAMVAVIAGWTIAILLVRLPSTTHIHCDI